MIKSHTQIVLERLAALSERMADVEQRLAALEDGSLEAALLEGDSDVRQAVADGVRDALRPFRVVEIGTVYVPCVFPSVLPAPFRVLRTEQTPEGIRYYTKISGCAEEGSWLVYPSDEEFLRYFEPTDDAAHRSPGPGE